MQDMWRVIGRLQTVNPRLLFGAEMLSARHTMTLESMSYLVRLCHRRTGFQPAFKRLRQILQRAIAVGDERVALVLAAGDERGEAADAKLLRDEEVAEGLVLGLR